MLAVIEGWPLQRGFISTIILLSKPELLAVGRSSGVAVKRGFTVHL